MLSTLAPIAMAYLGKEKKQTNAGSADLNGLLGGLLGSQQKGSSGGIMDIITGVIDKDGDGDIVDDLIGMFGKKK